jgi:hypothetical protein
MPTPRIEIRFVKRPAFSAELIATVVNMVEQTVFETEYSDLIAAIEEFPDMPPIVRDAALVRIERYRGRSLQFQRAESGSIVLIGAVAGLAYWILSATLGETFKRAWLETDLHRKLKDFHKSLQRMRHLYEATIHSYGVLYEDGRRRLRGKDVRRANIEFVVGGTVLKRSLKIITYHARDVYPNILRSTLLIRLVAAYEAFLVDAIEEIAQRTDTPFVNDKRIEMSQGQFLTIARDNLALRYIVKKTTRQLTSGGLEDIRKFYQSSLGIDMLASGQSLDDIEEIHDRRHLYVHRSGYADAQYCKKYSKAGLNEDELIPVTETYWLGSLTTLEASALHVKGQLENRYPDAPARKYKEGSVKLIGAPEHLQYLSLEILTESGRAKFCDLNTKIRDDVKLGDILVWMSDDGNEVRYLIGCDSVGITNLMRLVHRAEKAGDIRRKDGFKICREKTDAQLPPSIPP